MYEQMSEIWMPAIEPKVQIADKFWKKCLKTKLLESKQLSSVWNPYSFEFQTLTVVENDFIFAFNVLKF